MAELVNIEQASLKNLSQRAKGDKVIWAIVILLGLISLLAVYSSTGMLAYRMNRGNTEVYLFKQVVFIAMGITIIYFMHRVNYTFYSRLAVILFLLSIPLLLYTLLYGVTLNEGSRWIRVPIINLTFQTSDLAKLALFMYVSRQLSRRQLHVKDLKKGFLPVIIPVCVICLLIAPANLSTALLLGASCLMLMFIGRIRAKYLLVTVGIALLPVIMLVTLAMAYYNKQEQKCDELPGILQVSRIPTWIKRVQNFMYTSKDMDKDDNYQINQAKIGIAKGGWVGLGPGNSESRNFLPHPYSDFIYAIIIEEYGLLGGAFLIMIYLLFLFRSIRLFRRCPYAFGAFLALGLSFTLVIQALTNMAVNVNLFPVTGVTLPLVSMGGSSFLFTCVSIGIILSVARNVEQSEGGEPAAGKREPAVATA